MSATDRCLEHNTRYAQAFEHGDLAAPPAAALVVVTCMDARIDPAAMLGLALGDAHVLRNGGGIVTEDTIRSIAISQSMLGTREVMVVQHTACGLLGASDETIKDAIRERTGATPRFKPGAFHDLEQSVRESVARLATSPVLAHRDAIRGFVYEVETGRLREVA